MVHGARHSLTIGLAATAIAVAGGVLLGLLAGLAAPVRRRGAQPLASTCCRRSRSCCWRCCVIAVAGPGTASLIVAIGIATLPHYARVVRAQTLLVRRAGYVEQAVSFGLSRPRLVLRHVLPNVLGPVPVLAMIGLGEAILGRRRAQLPRPGPAAAVTRVGRDALRGPQLSPAWPGGWRCCPGAAVTATVVGADRRRPALQARFDGRQH